MLRFIGPTGLLLLVLLAAPPVQSQTELDARQSYIYGTPDTPTDMWRLAHGGRIYDNWWVALEQEQPNALHPAYPRSGSANPAASWRCVTCHGWDYEGSDGSTVGLSRMPSVLGMQGRDPDRVKSIVRDRRHRYSERMIPDAALDDLAFFLTAGLADSTRFVDRETGEVFGDAARGREVYQNVCAACHNFSGNAAIYGEAEDLRTLGAIANASPWQALHKIRNGQPGADMLAMRVFDEALVADVIAYLKTLPIE